MIARLLAKVTASRDETPEEDIDRRIARRYLLPGSKVRVIVKGLAYDLRLKDLSWRGLCGLTDAPLARAQWVEILFADGEKIEAQIRWSRTVVVGAVFREPLSDDTLRRLWRRYQSSRSRRGDGGSENTQGRSRESRAS